MQTGGRPHTAIRDDITANLDATDEFMSPTPLDPILVESGGDNPHGHLLGLVDATSSLTLPAATRRRASGRAGVTYLTLLVKQRLTRLHCGRRPGGDGSRCGRGDARRCNR